MGDVAIIEAPTFDAWVQTGRALLDQRTDIEWQLADWIADGKQQFGEQVGFDFLADQLGIAPKQLRTAARVAEAFPPARRSTALPFEVHAKLLSLPAEDRLPTLARAASEHWKEDDARRAVTEHRQHAAMFEDDDPERLATLMYRAWNSAQVEVRRLAWPLIQEAARNGFADIDEEVVIDA